MAELWPPAAFLVAAEGLAAAIAAISYLFKVESVQVESRLMLNHPAPLANSPRCAIMCGQGHGHVSMVPGMIAPSVAHLFEKKRDICPDLCLFFRG